MPDQCYFQGEFYQCTTATNAGESPATTPAKWRKVQIPARWRWFLSRLSYAYLLELDGQGDKATEQRQVALETERVGLLDTIRREVNRELKLGRTNVQTPYNARIAPFIGLRPVHLQPNSYLP